MLFHAVTSSDCFPFLSLDYKWARGFDPAVIHSVHYICHPGLRQAVNQFIDFETEANVGLSELLLQKSVVGSGSDASG